ncbi:MAG: class I SAM-dependent methyltransferase [Acidobacteriota bacterium]
MSELEKWQSVRDIVGEERITLGPFCSFHLRHTPRRMLFALSRYKFAAKMLGEGREVLEIGCSEGFGTVLLAEFARRVVGVDVDEAAVQDAKKAFDVEKVEFRCLDFLGAEIGQFDGAVSLDVIEHIYPENESLFFESICKNLKEHGICIIGTPNQEADKYASPQSKAGHVNMYTWDRLRDSMDKYFHNVFMFSANDEVVHTGFYPMAHYLIGVGVGKR